MWLHFRSFPESQIHFARKDKSRSFRIHSGGLQIKSQIGCSFCLGCVFICQEWLSSWASTGACYCQSPHHGARIVTSSRDTPGGGLCPLLGPGSHCCSHGEGCEIGSPGRSFKEPATSGSKSPPGLCHWGPVPNPWRFSLQKGWGFSINAQLSGEGNGTVLCPEAASFSPWKRDGREAGS